MPTREEFNQKAIEFVYEEDDKFLLWISEATTDRMLDNWDGGSDWLGNSWGTHQAYGREGQAINLILSGAMQGSVDYMQLYDALKGGSFNYSAYPAANKGGGSYAEIQQMQYQWHPIDFEELTDFDQTDVEEGEDKLEEGVMEKVEELLAEWDLNLDI